MQGYLFSLFSVLHASAWSIIGLVVNLVGVILLFRFGIPYYVRTGGAISIVTEQIDNETVRDEQLAGRIGWLGLMLVGTGTVCQIVGSYLSWT